MICVNIRSKKQEEFTIQSERLRQRGESTALIQGYLGAQVNIELSSVALLYANR